MDKNTELIKLIERAKNKDDEAVELLINSVRKKLFFYIRSIIKDENDVQDVCQEAFIIAFDKINELKDPLCFESWLFSIARNKALKVYNNYYGQGQKRSYYTFAEIENDTDSILDIKDESVDSDPRQKIDREMSERIIKEIIYGLPIEQRQVIMLYYFEELKIKEVADCLKCSENTVKSRMKYAKEKIEADIKLIQKRDDIKLYNFAPFSIFLMMLNDFKEDNGIIKSLDHADLPEESKDRFDQNKKQKGSANHKENISKSNFDFFHLGLSAKIILFALASSSVLFIFLFKGQPGVDVIDDAITPDAAFELYNFDNDSFGNNDIIFNRALQNMDDGSYIEIYNDCSPSSTYLGKETQFEMLRFANDDTSNYLKQYLSNLFKLNEMNNYCISMPSDNGTSIISNDFTIFDNFDEDIILLNYDYKNISYAENGFLTPVGSRTRKGTLFISKSTGNILSYKTVLNKFFNEEELENMNLLLEQEISRIEKEIGEPLPIMTLDYLDQEGSYYPEYKYYNRNDRKQYSDDNLYNNPNYHHGLGLDICSEIDELNELLYSQAVYFTVNDSNQLVVNLIVSDRRNDLEIPMRHSYETNCVFPGIY